MFFGHLAALLLRRCPLWPILLVLCGLWSLPSPARAHDPQAGLDLRETLAGIIGYTRWPTEPDPLRLCVVGESPRAGALVREGLPRTGAPAVTVRKVAPDAGVAAQCDALYVGALDAAAWQALLPGLVGRAVLTVCERSEACTAGGMVRLDIDATARTVRFEVNLDAVARSTVRIHPLVLKLGRRSAAKVAP